MNRLVLLLILLYLAIFAWIHRDLYTTPYDARYWEDRYLNSAYIKGDKADFILSDSELYALEGHFLVNETRDLENLTAGHPPAGKYLIGLSLRLFNNPHILSLLAGLGVLLLVYQIGLGLNLHPVLALLATAAVGSEPLFREQLITSLLDIYLLLFALASVYFYLKNRLFAAHFSLGLALAAKFFPTIAPLAVALMLATLLTGSFPAFLKHLYSLIALPAGFLLGHLTYFFYHPSILDFARYQRYIVSWWAGSPQVAPGGVWDMIFSNRWHTWWGNEAVVPVETWWLGWPLAIGLGLLMFKRQPLHAWLVLSLLLFSFEAVYPRHLLVILPAAYLLTASLIGRIRFG